MRPIIQSSSSIVPLQHVHWCARPDCVRVWSSQTLHQPLVHISLRETPSTNQP